MFLGSSQLIVKAMCSGLQRFVLVCVSKQSLLANFVCVSKQSLLANFVCVSKQSLLANFVCVSKQSLLANFVCVSKQSLLANFVCLQRAPCRGASRYCPTGPYTGGQVCL